MNTNLDQLLGGNRLNPLPSLRGLLQSVRNYFFHHRISSLKRNLFMAHARRLVRRRTKVVLTGVLLLVAGFWPVDFLIIPDPETRRIFSAWRGMTILTIGTSVVLVEFSDFLQRWVNAFYVIVFSLHLPLSGYMMGLNRGLSFPWLYLGLIVPMCTVIFSMSQLKRFLTCLWLSSLYVGAYVLTQADPLQYEYYGHVMTMTSSAVVLGSITGHVIHQLDYVTFENRRSLKVKRQKVTRLARKDQLTGLNNRREFERRYFENFHARSDRPFALIMLDLDDFKSVNDTYGHAGGDLVLDRMGTFLEERSRREDIPGRLGGDEFAVALPDTRLDEARDMAERLKRDLRNHDFRAHDGQTFTVSCSIGIAVRKNGEQDPEALQRRADNALYESKETPGTVISSDDA